MKRKLLLSCALMFATSSIYAQPKLNGQLETSTAQAMPVLQENESQAFSVGYKRPRGVFYCPYYTKDNATGVWGYYAPWLHSDPYRALTFTNTSTGANSYSWKVTVKKNLKTETLLSSETDFTVPYELHINDSLPMLTAVGNDTTASYTLGGYKNGEFKNSYLWNYPNWQYANFEENKIRHMWETSKYMALKSDRTGTAKSSSYFHTLDEQYKAPNGDKAYIFGRNTAGYDYSGIAFEKPDYPYLINHVGIKYQKLKWSKNANALIKAEIYEIEDIPAYSKTEAVSPKLVRRIATGLVTIDSTNTAASGILSVLMKDENGNTPEITTNILVMVSGYNAEGISDFTLLCSSDLVDEGYGELGYIGISGSDGKLNIVGVNNTVKSDFYTAPSIFIETERPWLTFRSNIEPEEHNFLTTGEVYTLELFSLQPASMWTITTVNAGNPAPRANKAASINLPSWIGLTITEETGGEMGYPTYAKFDIAPLPAGETFREATVRFAYPGAYLDYHITQGISTGVEQIEINKADNNAPTYNMLGQQVNANAKGLLIKNGKKILVK